MFEERDPIFEETNQAKLIEQIETAPNCKIYGVSKYNQRTIRISMAISLILALVLCLISVIFYHPILTFIFLAIVCLATLIALAILSYLNFAHNYYKTFVSELGIAKKSVYDEGAIPWDKIEYIEIKTKGGGFDYIIFRSGDKTLGFRNSHFAKRLSLEIISELIGGMDNWYIIDDFEEIAETTKSDKFYMRPDIDKSEGKKKLEEIILREYIGEQEYDASQTQEHISAKHDDELYKLIIADTQRECLKDDGSFLRIISKFSIIGLMFVTGMIAIFYAMTSGPFAFISGMMSIALFFLIFYSFFRGYEKLVLSPIGIARYFFDSPDALEWQHVESIDFHTEDNKILAFEFFGNKRRVFCPPHIYKDLLPIELIRKYITDLDGWNRMKRNSWKEGTFRLIRPDT